jgi:hypothetical protein
MTATPVEKPVITRTVTGWRVWFEDWQLSIEATDLSDFYTYMTVRQELKEGTTIVESSKVNLMGTRSISEFVKALTSRDGHLSIPWRAIIDHAKYAILTENAKGEPLVELCASENNEDEIKPPPYLCKPLVVHGYPNVIFGDTGALKSHLAVLLAATMETPEAGNKLGFICSDKPLRCLYLDWETDQETIKWQLSIIRRGMNLPTLFLPYRKCSGPLWQDFDQIQRLVDKTKADVTFIDSLGLACGGNLNDTEPALKVFSCLRKLPTTPVILAHTAKNSEMKSKSIYGNLYFTAESRNIWFIVKDQEKGESHADVGLTQTKPPPFSMPQQDLAFRFTWDKNSLKVEKTNPKNVAGLSEKRSVKAKIKEALEDEPLMKEQLVERLHELPNTITQTLKRMSPKEVVALADGRYALVSQYSMEGQDNES